MLQPLFNANPRLYVSGDGSVAYWLGRAYKEKGDSDVAAQTWKEGLSSLDRQGKFDLKLGEAFVRSVFQEQRTAEYSFAARVYLKILSLAGADLSNAEQVLVEEHLRQLAVILPASVQEASGIRFDTFAMDISLDPSSNAGETLVSWWRAQDMLPATQENERLIEHLQRVAYARQHYASAGRLDDRGLTYVRFGDPTRDVNITLDDAGNMNVRQVELLTNEFWTYEDVHPQAYYLFIEKDPGYYELGRVDDLIPARSRPMVGNDSRSRRYVFALEKILRQLAVHSEDYAMRYARVADFAAWERDRAGGGGIGDEPLEGGPGQFGSRIEAQVQNLDRRFAAQRAKRVPESDSDLEDKITDLPVYYRISRFLTPSDSTRIEVYWSARSQDLLPDENLRERLGGGGREVPLPPYAIRAVAAQEDQRHIDRTVHYRQHLVQVAGDEQAILAPRTIDAAVPDSIFHVALQWDQYEVIKRSEKGLQIGRLLRRHTRRLDTLKALSAHPDQLEMSDLVVRTVTDGQRARITDLESTVPYPFQSIRATTPLALSFEIYHLSYGERDRTRYTVDYEIRRRTEQGALGRLFGTDKEKETVTSTTYEGSSRRSSEFIIIDLADLEVDDRSTVSVKVRVTDETSGQSVERTTDLVVVPNSE